MSRFPMFTTDLSHTFKTSGAVLFRLVLAILHEGSSAIAGATCWIFCRTNIVNRRPQDPTVFAILLRLCVDRLIRDMYTQSVIHW